MKNEYGRPIHPQKDYLDWTAIKSELHNNIIYRKRLYYHEGEIYWTCVGENIGYEQDGSGEKFIRPVLILAGISADLFLGAPLTSQTKNSKYSRAILTNKLISRVLLNQIRVFDTARIIERKPLFTVPSETLFRLKTAIATDLLGLKFFGER